MTTQQPPAPHDDRSHGHVSVQHGGPLPRRAFLGLLGSAAVTGVLGYGVAGTYRFEIERIRTSLPGLRAPATVAWLADLHYGPYIRAGSIASWVDATLDLGPDVIVLGGDTVDYMAPPDIAPLLEHLSRLRAPLGVYAVWGNHEYIRYPDIRQRQRFEAALADAGVVMLQDRGVALREDLYVAGVDTERVGRDGPRRAIEGRPPEGACLLAAHKPEVLPYVPPEVDLTLCGHTHGGQIVLPGIGPLVDRSGLGRDAVAGWVRAPGLGYVSRGLGVTHLPIRINCPGELTLVRLTPA